MSHPDFNLRRAESAADAETLLRLIEKLAEFERLAPPDEGARERFVRDGFDRKPPRFEAWLAEDAGGQAIGYALFFETYSTFLCRPTLYLEDLFVLPDYRGRGIGKALMNQCIQLARDRGCGRMEWACLDWNVKAQAFYHSLGAQKQTEWNLYRLVF
ncbi:MAG TPA: GNAT family N-acetyltransferase [Capsulimonadaceae bacterium]|nr:GNAT family N-acetyltransferase [Capsulimonadaceae bacterium]